MDRAEEVLARLRELIPRMCDTNADAVRAYCRTVAELEHAERQLEESGVMIVTTNGDVKPSPWVAIVDGKRRMIVSMATSLGLNKPKRNK